MEHLLNLINRGTSPYQVVAHCIEQLIQDGFQELKLNEEWQLSLGGRYYVCPYPSVLIAFTQGGASFGNNIRIGAAHTDQPMLKVKPNPEMTEGKYCKVNVGRYGGLINNTWLDRPLAVAGKVMLKGKDAFSPVTRLFDGNKPVCIVPNVAIHMNSKVNQGIELNAQVDMIPIMGLCDGEKKSSQFFRDYLAAALNVKADEILDFDLYLYNRELGEIIGNNDEFISAPRLDNLASVQALMEGLMQPSRADGMNLIALFDNEEIGSRSKQGADSLLLSMVLEKVYESIGFSHGEYIGVLANSFMISADGAHAVHPNHKEKSDPSNFNYLGDGITLKTSATQRYVTDSEASAVILGLCQANNIPCQRYVNRSDMAGGQTLGPLISSYLPVMSADLGVPMLAMHSARELAAVSDYQALVDLARVFYQ